jgi:hypothetical protein
MISSTSATEFYFITRMSHFVKGFFGFITII